MSRRRAILYILCILSVAMDLPAQTGGGGAVAPHWLPPGQHDPVPARFKSDVHGAWSPVHDWRSNIITGTAAEMKHMYLVPNGTHRGKVMMWQFERDGQTNATYLWDPAAPSSLTATSQNLRSEIACCGMTMRPNGDALIAGGVDYATVGVAPLQPDETYVINSSTQSLSQLGALAIGGRFYPSLITLNAAQQSRTVCMGGVYFTGILPFVTGHAIRHWELFNPNGTTWQNLANVGMQVGFDTYPRAYCLSDGRIFSSSDTRFHTATTGIPATGSGQTYFATVNTGAMTVDVTRGPNLPGNIDPHFNSSVLLHRLVANGGHDRLLVFGGAEGSSGVTVYRDVFEFETASGTGTVNRWHAKKDMAVGRTTANAQVLPTGEIVILGGSWWDRWHNIGNPDYVWWPVGLPEIYDPGDSPGAPGTTRWGAPRRRGHAIVGKTLTPRMEFTPRVHHAMSVLLPDGRVLLAGGENVVAGWTPIALSTDPSILTAEAALTGEVYSPPYMFHPVRPKLSRVPTTARFSRAPAPYSIPFKVTAKGASSQATIDRVVLVRPTAVTHHFSPTQRYIELPFTVTGSLPGEIAVIATAPLNTLGPRGPYMLFAVLNDGGRRTPSVASWIDITN